MKRFLPQIILAALIAIYFIANPKTEKGIETALLNPKYSPDKITLSYEKEGTAIIAKQGGFWVCDYVSPDGKRAVFPCDSTVVEKILYYSKSILKVYEISNSLKAKDSLGLSEKDVFCLKFCQNDKILSKIFFGAADSRHRIAFYADKQKKIYCTDSPILNYLSVSPDFWCDPYIFPQSVCGSLEDGVARLRHGKLFLGAIEVYTQSVEIDDGKGNFYKAFFVPASDDEMNYYCRFVATPSAARDESEKLAIKRFDYTTTVSAWTFNKVVEEAQVLR